MANNVNPSISQFGVILCRKENALIKLLVYTFIFLKSRVKKVQKNKKRFTAQKYYVGEFQWSSAMPYQHNTYSIEINVRQYVG